MPAVRRVVPFLVRVGVLAAAIPAAAACGGGSSATSVAPTAPVAPVASTTNAIAIADNSFSPKATTVAVGTTVTWTWTGGASHNVTFDDGAKSASQQSGTYTRTFPAAGTYPYHCSIHGASMSGTITVQ